MSIFNDFHNSFSEGLYAGIPDHDGGHLILKNGTVVDHLSGHGGLAVIKNGEVLIKTTNLQGGEDTFVNGKLTRHTAPNIHGDMDTFNSDHCLTQKTIPNSHGGENIYDDAMHLKGMTMPNAFGAESMLVLDDSNHGNAAEIMGYNDPLAAAFKYNLPAFYFK